MIQAFRRPEALVAAGLGALGAAAFLFDGARAVGMGLFRHVADSYLVMFVDTMSFAFICF